MIDPYADIRPYRDDEVAPVLNRLLADPELVAAIAALRFGTWARPLAPLLHPVVRWYLRRQVRSVHTIHDLQMIIRSYMASMIEDTTAGLTVSGLTALPADRAYLFISNHRDIAMDPAFTNYALDANARNTVRIAIGDNLLTKPWVADLMRLNKSFIVKRSAAGPRELLTASRHLASYMRHSLQEEGAPVWIAQREGRAKDGIDRTEPAVIKMLLLGRDKATEDFGTFVAGLNIVPVAISYELDPCDALKARELYQRSTTGAYQKGAQEDVTSIAAGIAGSKGRVHVSFGSPLGAEFESVAAVVTEIDRQIISNYHLHPSNLLALEALEGRDAAGHALPTEPGSISRAAFNARIQAMPEAERPFALAIYANAVRSKMKLLAQPG